jgi:hypothetical protein
MKKIEIIWRELLFQTLEKGINRFTQKDLAGKFGFSTSTIFQALKNPRKMGAVIVTGRDFVLQDPEKLLYHWASIRNFSEEIIYKTKVNLPILEIEAQIIPSAVYGCFSSYRLKFNDTPADYDKIYIYSSHKKLEELTKRFPAAKSQPNLFILQADKFLSSYGKTTSLAHTFVDLWNLSDWFAKEYVNSLKEKINAILS